MPADSRFLTYVHITKNSLKEIRNVKNQRKNEIENLKYYQKNISDGFATGSVEVKVRTDWLTITAMILILRKHVWCCHHCTRNPSFDCKQYSSHAHWNTHSQFAYFVCLFSILILKCMYDPKYLRFHLSRSSIEHWTQDDNNEFTEENTLLLLSKD